MVDDYAHKKDKALYFYFLEEEKTGLLKKIICKSKLAIQNCIYNLKSGMSLSLSQNFGFDRIEERYSKIGNFPESDVFENNQNINNKTDYKQK